MAVMIKSEREIGLIREACRRLAIVHQELEQAIRPGLTTYDIDMLGDTLIKKLDGIPSFKNYNGFPASLCISVNDEVVHGIPSKKRVLQDGDIVSLDIGLRYKGYHSDAARTHGVGQISPEAQRLIDGTKESFFVGAAKAKAGNYLYDISNAVAAAIAPYGYGIVRDLVGHGIGAKLHEDPQLPHFAQKKKGLKLQKGMTLCVEPMINMGRADVEWLDDDWTVVTQDGSWSAHYENTILVTDGLPELLTIYGEDARRVDQGMFKLPG
jgi:methionyl aminopeptidase